MPKAFSNPKAKIFCSPPSSEFLGNTWSGLAQQWIHFSASVSIVVTFSITVIKKKNWTKIIEKMKDLFSLSFGGTVQHGSGNHRDSVTQLAAMLGMNAGT